MPKIRTRPSRFLNLLCLLGLLFLLPAARADVIDIDNTQLEKLLREGVPLVDVRTESEWRETGMIPASRAMTFFDERGRYDAPAWLARLKPVAAPDTPVILVCRTGNRTQMISQFLSAQAGYRTVYNVKQGIKGWLREKRPVEAYK